MSRLRYYWVARDGTGGQDGSAITSTGQGNVDTTADDDTLAKGSNVELQMLHSRYSCIYFLGST